MNDDAFLARPPVSAFYRGRPRKSRLHSFRPTHETQAKLDRQRRRSQKPKGKAK